MKDVIRFYSYCQLHIYKNIGGVVDKKKKKIIFLYVRIYAAAIARCNFVPTYFSIATEMTVVNLVFFFIVTLCDNVFLKIRVHRRNNFIRSYRVLNKKKTVMIPFQLLYLMYSE